MDILTGVGMEQVLVNISSMPRTIMLPTGRPILVNPGFGVQGNYFLKFIEPGAFVVLAQVPAGFSIRGVSQPLVAEGVRPPSNQAIKVNSQVDPVKSSAKQPAKTLATAAAEQGKSASVADLATVATGNISSNSISENTVDGSSREVWTKRIAGISDATFAQQTKLSTLKELAHLFEISSELQTKAELITALRVKVNASTTS